MSLAEFCIHSEDFTMRYPDLYAVMLQDSKQLLTDGGHLMTWTDQWECEKAIRRRKVVGFPVAVKLNGKELI